MSEEVVQFAKLLRVGALAKRTSKTVRALHLYEELGLLHPMHRTRGGFRLYHPASVARVEWIQKLQDAGYDVTLDDFTLFLSGYQQQGASLSGVEQALAAAPQLTTAERQAMLAAIQAVPEPAALGVVAFSTLALHRHRRRKGSR